MTGERNNALSNLYKAATLGMKLTEIPPREFSRKSRGDDYFVEYGKFAKEAFTTVTAHAPYYNIVSEVPAVKENVLKAMKDAVRKAGIAGATIFNLHLGWKVYGDERDVEEVGDFIKQLLDVAPEGMLISIETTYTRAQLGSIEEIKKIIEYVGSDRVIISAQLENVFMYEFKIDQHGNFHASNNKLMLTSG